MWQRCVEYCRSVLTQRGRRVCSGSRTKQVAPFYRINNHHQKEPCAIRESPCGLSDRNGSNYSIWPKHPETCGSLFACRDYIFADYLCNWTWVHRGLSRWWCSRHHSKLQIVNPWQRKGVSSGFHVLAYSHRCERLHNGREFGCKP